MINAAIGTAIPIAICSFWLSPDLDPAISVPAAVLLVSGVLVELLVSGMLAGLVGETLLEEGDVGWDRPFEAGAPDAIGMRVDPNVAVVVEVSTLPPVTSGHTNATARIAIAEVSA